MPHFDQYGGDEWICQAPNHSGNRIQNSRVVSTWRPDITGHLNAGNTCPPCVRTFETISSRQPPFTQTEQDLVLDSKEPINRLDYADDPAELEVQIELRRMGIKNTQRPTLCPDCQGQLESHRGMVGEPVLVCPTHGIVWEDSEEAIRRVL